MSGSTRISILLHTGQKSVSKPQIQSTLRVFNTIELESALEQTLWETLYNKAVLWEDNSVCSTVMGKEERSGNWRKGSKAKCGWTRAETQIKLKHLVKTELNFQTTPVSGVFSSYILFQVQFITFTLTRAVEF